ncbi:MAG: 50S ribosomal protein L21 [Rhodobacteraceae bacterium]|nr:50S ribosomal protein L21 [Paracoccaceae bacterium]
MSEEEKNKLDTTSSEEQLSEDTISSSSEFNDSNEVEAISFNPIKEETPEEDLDASSSDQADTSEDDNAEVESEPKKKWSILNPEISAVIALNGKQFPVKVGEKCRVLDLEIHEEGTTKSVNTVVLGQGEQTVLGDPYIKDAIVVLKSHRVDSQKLINFKKRRRKSQSKRTKGYRQKATVFLTHSINIPGLPESRMHEVVSD